MNLHHLFDKIGKMDAELISVWGNKGVLRCGERSGRRLVAKE